jgi:hypothetical protein
MNHVWKKIVESGQGIQESVATNLRLNDEDYDEDDDIFCYHRQDEAEALQSRNHVESSTRYRPAALVTSTRFDSNEALSAMAQSMLFQYEHDKMSEREIVDATLATSEDVRAFLEALDRDCADGDDSEISETLLQVRSVFLPTLQKVWKESSLMPSNIFAREPAEFVDLTDDTYHKPPKTPKNLRMSPITCPSYATSTFDAKFAELHTPSKRQRTWFFSDEQRFRNGLGANISNPFASGNIQNPFGSGKVLPEFRFEFGGKGSVIKAFEAPKKAVSNLRNLDFGNPFSSATTSPVHGMQLDGFRSPLAGSSYMPPTSPIRKVSMELTKPH